MIGTRKAQPVPVQAITSQPVARSACLTKPGIAHSRTPVGATQPVDRQQRAAARALGKRITVCRSAVARYARPVRAGIGKETRQLSLAPSMNVRGGCQPPDDRGAPSGETTAMVAKKVASKNRAAFPSRTRIPLSLLTPAPHL